MRSTKIIISSGLNQNIDNYINSLELFNAKIIIANPATIKEVLKNKYDGLVLTEEATFLLNFMNIEWKTLIVNCVSEHL